MALFVQITSSLLTALFLTIVIESIPLVFFSPRKKYLSVGFLCNILTNPLLNCLRILIYSFYPNPKVLLIFTIVSEVLIILGEGWLYVNILHISPRKGLFISALCNGLSYGLGLLLL